jgi:hypothetical protein
MLSAHASLLKAVPAAVPRTLPTRACKRRALRQCSSAVARGHDALDACVAYSNTCLISDALDHCMGLPDYEQQARAPRAHTSPRGPPAAC